MSEDLQIKFVIQTQQAIAKTKELQKNIDGVGTAAVKVNAKTGQNFLKGMVSSITGVVAAITGAIAAISGLIKFVNQSIAAFSEQQLATVALNGALRLNGKYTKEAADGLAEFASQMQQTVGVGDEAIMQSMALIERYAGLTVDQLKETTEPIANFSAATGIDFQQASMLFAKSISTDVNALGRYGVQLKAGMSDSEKFDSIIDQLNQKFAGAAVEKINTYAGQVQLLKNNFGDTQEIIGQFITSFLTPLIKEFNKLILIFRPTNEQTEKLSKAFATLGKVFTIAYKLQLEWYSLFRTFLSALGLQINYVDTFDIALQSLIVVFRVFGTVLLAVRTAVIFVGKAINTVYKIIQSFGVMIGEIVGTFVKFVISLTSVKNIIAKVKETFDNFSEIINSIKTRVKDLKDVFIEFTKKGAGIFGAAFEKLTEPVRKFFNNLLKGLKWLDGVTGGAISRFTGSAIANIRELASVGTTFVSDLQNLWTDVNNLNFGDQSGGGNHDDVDNTTNSINAQAASVEDLTAKYAALKAQIDELNDTRSEQNKEIDAESNAMKSALAELETYYNEGVIDYETYMSDKENITDTYLGRIADINQKYADDEAAAQKEKNKKIKEDALSLVDSLLSAWSDFYSQLAEDISDNLDATLEALDTERDAKLAAVTAESDAEAESTAQQISDLEKDIAYYKLVNDQKALSDAQQSLASIKAAQTQAEQEAAINAEYDAKEAEAQAKAEAEEAAYEKRAFALKKASSITSTIIDTAKAVIGFLANPGGAVGAAMSIAAGVTGAASLATIASQKAPTYAVGGVINNAVPLGEDGFVAVRNGESILTQQATSRIGAAGVGALNNGGSVNTITVQNLNIYAQQVNEKTIMSAVQSINKKYGGGMLA